MSDRYYIDFGVKPPHVYTDVQEAMAEGSAVNDIVVVEQIGWVDYLLEDGVIEE